MRSYSIADLERYDRLVTEARDRVRQQQAVIDQCVWLDELTSACFLLEELERTLASYEAERVRILTVL
jgi:hypothetical protein